MTDMAPPNRPQSHDAAITPELEQLRVLAGYSVDGTDMLRTLHHRDRLVEKIKRVLREQDQPPMPAHLSRGDVLETLLQAAEAFVRLAEERNEVMAHLRAIQKKYVRSGSA